MTASGGDNGGDNDKQPQQSQMQSKQKQKHPPGKKQQQDQRKILNINVGVLGHVDSGKTSLVKTLSTLLSTAALDKSSQSRQRGITLDLGFSAFIVDDIPPQLRRNVKPSNGGSNENNEDEEEYDCLQVTLVDCPGHASLIRTIIGGAQIIDMVLLVIDANKGVQTQTAECIVIAEMTTTNLIVAMNKIDLFPEAERQKKLEVAQRKVRGALASTRFSNAPMVGVSAVIGGEKAAAVGSNADASNSESAGGGGTSSANTSGPGGIQSMNIEGLLQVIKSQISYPNRRNVAGPFYFAIDHCFPIKGQGTVITGTVLSGRAKVNDMVSFPELGSAMDRKVKSIQMFKRQVQQVRQGDRCGMCLASLDSKLIERGVAATPGSVSLVENVIAIVRKVRFFRGKLVSDSKFHLSVGHATVMATVKFFGAFEIARRMSRDDGSSSSAKVTEEDGGGEDGAGGSSSLGGTSTSGLPRLKFDYDEDFIHQDVVVEDPRHLRDGSGGKNFSGKKSNNSSSSVGGAGSSSSSSPATSSTEPPLHWAILTLHTPVYCPMNSLVIGSRLDTDIQANTCRLAFSGRLIEKFDPKKDTARLKIYTWKEKQGVISRLGDSYTREKDQKVVRYEVYGNELFKRETNMSQFVGLFLETEAGDVGVIQSSFGTTGKFKAHFPAGTQAKEGDKLILRFKRYSNDPKKGMHQDAVLPDALPGTKLAPPAKKGKKDRGGGKKGGNSAGKNAKNDGASTPTAASETVATGEIASLKGDVLENGKHTTAVVAGFFTPEVNVREKVGMRVVIPDTKEEGKISGSFGKAGKCKVAFEDGVSAPVGTKVQLMSS